MSHSSDWQLVIDPPLLQRLQRPCLQPGGIDSRMAAAIIARHCRFVPQSPLLQHLLQRLERVMDRQAGDVPIVYAHPVGVSSTSTAQVNLLVTADSAASRSEGDASHSQSFPEGRSSAESTTIIQAKFEGANGPDRQALTSAMPPNVAAQKTAKESQPVQSSQQVSSQSSPASAPLPTVRAVSTPLPRNSLPVVSPLQRQSPLPDTAVQPLPKGGVIAGRETIQSSPGMSQVSPARTPTAGPTPLPSQPFLPIARQSSSPSPGNPLVTGSLPIVPPQPVAAAPNPTQPQLSVADSVNTPALANNGGFTLPLVQGSTGPRPVTADSSRTPLPASDPGGSGQIPVVQGQVAGSHHNGMGLPTRNSSPRAIASASPTHSPLDLNQLVDQVERKLRRKIVVERERRGWQS